MKRRKLDFYKKMLVAYRESWWTTEGLCHVCCRVLAANPQLNPYYCRFWLQQLEKYRTTAYRNPYWWPQHNKKIRVDILEQEITKLQKAIDRPWWKKLLCIPS